MYQYIIIKHVNNSFTVFSSTINVFTQDHTMIKYITVTVINQKFDPFIRSTFHVQSRSNLQNYCVAQNLLSHISQSVALYDQWGENTKYVPHLAGRSTSGHSSVQDDVLSCGYGTFVTQQK